jgi:hypothetical protein
MTDGRGCKVGSCSRPHKGRGYCNAHLKRHHAGRPLDRPIAAYSPRGSSLARDAAGNKRCGACEKWLPEARFAKQTTCIDGYQAWCMKCSNLHRQYRLKAADIDAMLSAQVGGCAICRKPLGEKYNVDHDHACCNTSAKSCGACVRGLLCRPCNQGLGHFMDSVDTLKSAINYLESFSK